MSQERGYRVYRVRRRRRVLRAVSIAAVVVVGGLAGSGAWLARAESGRLPPDVRVGGVEVGGLTVAEARARLAAEVARVAGRPIVLTYRGGRLETSGAELGARADVDGVLARAQESRDGISRLRARLGLTGEVKLDFAYAVDRRRLQKVVRRAARMVERPAVPAGVELAGDEVVVTPSQPGSQLDLAAAAESLSALPRIVRLTVRELPPPVSDEAAREAKATADALLAGPPDVVYRGGRTRLDPALLRRALSFRATPAGTIALSLDPAPLERPLRRAFARYEREPRDAAFRIRGKRAIVVPARRGVEISAARVARSLVEHVGAGRVRALFDPLVPDLTTAEARRLRVRRLVSEFTTPYPCCAPRVTNIQRAAEILDGTIVPAGGRFSLNEALGERTVERGFVLAPMIAAGRLVDAVGGGVSQVATTFYNAAFFAGLELVAHTPHQFYISRYPMGREATVSWGGPELIFRNDWPAAILVKVAAGDTSITVRFYSTALGRRVETETGSPYDYRAASTVRVANPALAPGEERVVQSGGVSGFSVDYTRTVYRGNRLRRDERFHVRYDPEDTIVEHGPEKKGSGAPAGPPAGTETGATPQEEPPDPAAEPAPAG